MERELGAALRYLHDRHSDLVGTKPWNGVAPDVEQVSVVIPLSQEQLDDWAPLDIGAMLERARRDAEWLARMRPAQRARVLRMRALIQRVVDDQRERERQERICPTCGCDPYEHGGDC